LFQRINKSFAILQIHSTVKIGCYLDQCWRTWYDLRSGSSLYS